MNKTNTPGLVRTVVGALITIGGVGAIDNDTVPLLAACATILVGLAVLSAGIDAMVKTRLK